MHRTGPLCLFSVCFKNLISTLISALNVRLLLDTYLKIYFLFHVFIRLAKVKKKLFENDEITEKDNIEDTPNKNIVKINMKLFKRQNEAKKTSFPSNNNNSIIIPLNMPGDEILIPSSEFPDLNEHNNEDPILDPADFRRKKQAKSKEKASTSKLENKYKKKEEKSTQTQKENAYRLRLLNTDVKVLVSLCVLQIFRRT